MEDPIGLFKPHGLASRSSPLVAPLFSSTLKVVLVTVGDHAPEDLVGLVHWLFKGGATPVEVQVKWLEDSLDLDWWQVVIENIG